MIFRKAFWVNEAFEYNERGVAIAISDEARDAIDGVFENELGLEFEQDLGWDFGFGTERSYFYGLEQWGDRYFRITVFDNGLVAIEEAKGETDFGSIPYYEALVWTKRKR